MSPFLKCTAWMPEFLAILEQGIEIFLIDVVVLHGPGFPEICATRR